MTQRPVRVRIAPSPTGDPHVGTAYIGLVNYVFARQNEGQFILRIEDTDQARSAPVFEQAIFDALRWFGVTWDEGPDVGGPHGPYRQSERSAIYAEHCEELLNSGRAYRCFCTRERLQEMREAQRAAKNQQSGYDGHCKGLSEAEIADALEAGTPYVVRLAVPSEGETVVHDRLRGAVSFQNEVIDDQILLKADGHPTYHLANVVDDHLMEITHVIRAEEWISSTPKHVLLYEAFGWEAPEFIHMPLLRNVDKSKISKRKNPVSLNWFREAGFLPEAMRNYLSLMGWAHPEEKDFFDLDELVQTYDVDRLSLGGPIFDLQKLRHINAHYLRQRSTDDLAATFRAQYLGDEYLEKVMELCKDRVQTLEDVFSVGACFFGEIDRPPVEKLVFNDRKASQSRKLLTELSDRLDTLARTGYDAATIQGILRPFMAEKELKAKSFFMVLRWAITGSKVSPPLFETMETLGRERVRRRLQQAQEVLKSGR